MSERSIERLREMQRKIEADARTVTTRQDLIRLRAYWGDIEAVITEEVDNGE